MGSSDSSYPLHDSVLHGSLQSAPGSSHGPSPMPSFSASFSNEIDQFLHILHSHCTYPNLSLRKSLVGMLYMCHCLSKIYNTSDDSCYVVIVT